MKKPGAQKQSRTPGLVGVGMSSSKGRRLVTINDSQAAELRFRSG